MSAGPQERPLAARAVLWLRGDLIRVAAAAPAPIGTRVRVDLAIAGVAIPGELKGKVIDVRREGDGFAATVRLHSLGKEQRAALAALPSPG